MQEELHSCASKENRVHVKHDLFRKGQQTKGATDCRTSGEGDTGRVTVGEACQRHQDHIGRYQGTYSPLAASYRSVSARLVGVSLIQVAISRKNIWDVFVEAMAAASICQSPAFAVSSESALRILTNLSCSYVWCQAARRTFR